MVNTNDYGDLHRALIQAMMAHGTIEKKTLVNIFKQLCAKFAPGEDIEPKDADKVIEKINEKISRFDQKIELYEYGLTNENYYVFCSTAQTSMSKMQNTYNEDELYFFKLILMKITSDDDLRITPRDALNLCSEIPTKMNKTRAEVLLDTWIQCNYFFKHRDNQIYLGPKVLTEFKELLQSMELRYLKSCLLCESIAVWGDRCAKCETIYHSACIRKFLKRSDTCPSCKEKWEVPDAN